jgi:hypothetical protein
LGDLDVFGVAAAGRHLRLELGIVALGRCDVRVDDEDQFAPLRPETFAATALARLDDDGTALR